MHKEIMTNSPLFSVVMPVYNVKKYIKESIESVLNQTFCDFELVIVDDGSTDGCYEICDYYAEKDKRCKVIHQENKGLLMARRSGIKIASGSYLLNVDSDDKCVLTMLEELAEIIHDNTPDMIIYNYFRIDCNGVISNHKPLYKKEFVKLDKQLVINRFVSSVDLNPMWIKCTRLELVDRECDYSSYGKLNMAEDQLQSAALFERTNRIFFYNKPLYLYRYNDTSITKMYTSKMIIDSLVAKKRVLMMLDICNASEYTFKLFYKKYYRILNGYLLKSLKQHYSIDEFERFRRDLKSYELEEVKYATFIDKCIYKVLDSDNRIIKKSIRQLYKFLSDRV